MRRFETGPAPRRTGVAAQPLAPAAPELPAWLAPAPREARQPRPSPSSLAPETSSSPHGGAGGGRVLALRLGSAVHRLLERLPDHPAGQHERLAGRLLAHEFADLSEEHRRVTCEEAARAMAMPEARSVFGRDSLAEVAAAIPGPGPDRDGMRMIGRIDRLVVGPDQVLIVDFKTDRAPPTSPAEVPRGYLAQLGAYRAAMLAAFPGRPVGAALLWTAGPTLMRLDPGAVDLAYAESMIALTTAYRNIDLPAGRS